MKRLMFCLSVLFIFCVIILGMKTEQPFFKPGVPPVPPTPSRPQIGIPDSPSVPDPLSAPSLEFKYWKVGRAEKNTDTFITNTETTCQIIAKVGYTE